MSESIESDAQVISEALAVREERFPEGRGANAQIFQQAQPRFWQILLI